MHVRTALGERLVIPRVPIVQPAGGRSRYGYRRLLQAVGAVRADVPPSSAAAINRAVELFRRFLRWAGVEESQVGADTVCAFLLSRVAPPSGLSLPAHSAWARPVMPVTAAGDVDALRRAARLRHRYALGWEQALLDARVFEFQRLVRGRDRRLTTNKAPFLFRNVVAAWGARGDSDIGLRDAAAVVTGFFFGCRRSELVNMNVGDVVLSRSEVTVAFLREKARRPGILGPQEPRRVACGHPLLVRALRNYCNRFRIVGLPSAHPFFFGHHHQRLAPSWVGRLVRQLAPDLTAHSLRVGLAIEAYAAGCSVEIIQQLGRWNSTAAVLYIVGSADAQVLASRGIGSAGLRMESGSLRACAAALHSRIWRIPQEGSPGAARGWRGGMGTRGAG